MTKDKTNILIIGSGPAGYTAAIYAARAGLQPHLLTGEEPGGQLTTTNEVENFPGYPKGINGPQMMIDLEKQAKRFGTKIFNKTIVSVNFSVYPFVLMAHDKESILANSVVVATGASAKYLGLPSEKKFANKGVSACAICDGYYYRGKEVAVVGAGDSAAEEATYLSKLCTQVHLIVRKDYMKASNIMQERVLKTPNIKIYWNTKVDEVLGNDSGVTGAQLINNTTAESKKISIEGFFLAIGHSPNSSAFKGHIDMDNNGYIKVIPGRTQTSIKGVFAVGDVVDRVYRQAITAAGTGCMGALDAEKFLSERVSLTN